LKNKLVYSFIFLFVFKISGQQKQFDLSKGGCRLFNGNIYTYGLSGKKNNTVFYIYKQDLKLIVLDSHLVEQGNGTPENYLQIYSDTLHDHLNLYLQKKEKKAVTILRFNKKFELVATLENIDIARLNNTAMFSSEVLYFRNTVYSIKTESDTSGKQFYLNKYQLKSETTNFDYEFKWQFPFERKNIHSAHIFHADKSFVFLFVMVSGGTKNGQWILKIESGTGKLLKATKLNDKGETKAYLFGSFFADKNYKSITLVGQKFSEAELNPRPNQWVISSTGQLTVYAIEIDSLGEIVTKADFRIPINDIKTGMKKGPNTYLLRLNDLTKRAAGGLTFTGDVFKIPHPGICYFYTNTLVFNIVPAEDKLALEKNTISPNLQVEDYYITTDKLDLNGKLCSDTLNQQERIFYKTLTFPVKQEFKLDADKNPIWILGKHTTKKNSVNYSFLSPVKKVYQLTTIEEIAEQNNPNFISLSRDSFLISSQPEEGKYQLKLYSW